MIEITDKKNCCGCMACQQICPKHCISMQNDVEGFLYPNVKIDICINCNLCKNVCPVFAHNNERIPINVYAAKNLNEKIRKQSSSGGIFTLLAEKVINNGGVVFGAKFNEKWDVIHDYSETKSDLKVFRGSKYVQSITGDTFIKAENFLKEGRQLLFSGTPCQIAGLKLFLRKEYDNLFTVDFICHGTPSPLVWDRYKESLTEEDEIIRNINFRNKINGWKRFSFSYVKEKNSMLIESVETLDKNIFLRGFLKDLYLRPSCHKCPVKKLRSGSNITIADFWGIDVISPNNDDDKGYSLIFLNDVKGVVVYDEIKQCFSGFEVDYNDIRKYNTAIFLSVKPHKKRDFFFKQLQNKKDISTLIESCLKLNLTDKGIIFTKKIISVILHFLIYDKR